MIRLRMLAGVSLRLAKLDGLAKFGE